MDDGEIEGETELRVEDDGGDDGGDDERGGGCHRLHHCGQVLEDGAGDDAHVHEATVEAAREAYQTLVRMAKKLKLRSVICWMEL